MTVADPWKGFRGVLAGTLVIEAIAVGLAVLMLFRLGGGLTPVGGGYVGGLAVAMLVAAFLQRRRWGLGLALVLQLAMIAGAFVHLAVGLMGLVFAGVWGYLLYVRSEVARRMAEGSLPAQQRTESPDARMAGFVRSTGCEVEVTASAEPHDDEENEQ